MVLTNLNHAILTNHDPVEHTSRLMDTIWYILSNNGHKSLKPNIEHTGIYSLYIYICIIYIYIDMYNMCIYIYVYKI